MASPSARTSFLSVRLLTAGALATGLAFWPRAASAAPDSSAGSAEVAETHWAFRAVAPPPTPDVADAAWVRSPIDAFVLSRLEHNALSPSPQADRRTLIRRAQVALTGLPPTFEEVAAFVADDSPRAYDRLIDRLLDSPRYGEQFGRRWLDVARYSDTKGYVYAREERFWPHAWAYRDWVIRALNEDMPYDRFLLLQLAADGVQDRRDNDLAAMGFLTLGRRFLGVKHDIIDDRIDVVTRGAMGLTVSCARCHDHKYDPVPTADYYSLYGIFDSSAEQLTALGGEEIGDEAFRAGLKQRRDKLRQTMAKHRAASSARVRARIGDYLKAQTELEKYPADGFDQIFEKSDLLPSFVHRWARHLEEAGRSNDPVFLPWREFLSLRDDDFAGRAERVAMSFNERSDVAANPIVLAAFEKAPASFQEVIDRYAAVFADIDAQWSAAVEKAAKAGAATPTRLDNPAAEELRRILHGPKAPCEVPDLPIVHSETYFASGETTELWKLQGEVDRWIVRSGTAAPFALSLRDRPDPADARVFVRGNPLTRGPAAPRRFLSALAGENAEPFRKGSGRLELARAIVDPANPLTARVIVNRVWTRLFGQGLVTTPSDFGLRADPPSHPGLLDWLAARFVREGWSLKKLHRAILLSATFRQSSAGPGDVAARRTAQEKDPDNRLLWRMNARRLTFEEFRDSMFAVGGDLDLETGGRPTDMFKPPFAKRRAIYGLVDRQFVPGTLRVFDFANPDLHIPKRAETTVPQQALFFLNHPLVHERAARLASLAEDAASGADGVRALFRNALQRDPTDAELAEAVAFIDAVAAPESAAPPATAKDWSYGHGKVDEAKGRVANFRLIPHFTGDAWQGGAKWPDTRLGWVQLHATGGHPGNTREVASIRRWTAPRAMTIAIRSRLIHEPPQGDGIRAFIVSSRAGILKQVNVHQQTLDLDVPELTVAQGETVDFVVDINQVLNSDQYLWTVETQETDNASTATNWNSAKDFQRRPARQLSAREQLAQTLLCSNEFLFVD